MSRKRKRDAVLLLLSGEDLDTVSRALGVTAATLSGWRDALLVAGEASLASRPAGGEEIENERLKALERENRELRQANEILRKASAYFAQAELERRFKP